MNDQTIDGEFNILWLNIANKLELNVDKTLPIRSVLHHNDTFIGTNGIWHSFYGEKDKSIFAFEGHSLKLANNSEHYLQKRHDGLFRERASLSAAIIECVDGIVIFQNPWSCKPLTTETLRLLFKLHQFRPEYSWIDISTKYSFAERIEAELSFHHMLLEL